MPKECIPTALPIAQAQRILMDHLSPITPLVPMAGSKGQKLCSEMKGKMWKFIYNKLSQREASIICLTIKYSIDSRQAKQFHG